MSAAEAKILLTVPEAAVALRIGRSTAYDLAHAWLESDGTEGLPVVIIGGSLRVPMAAIDRLFAIGGFGPAWPSGLDRRRSPHRSATASKAADPVQASPASTEPPQVQNGPGEAIPGASKPCADEPYPSQSALTEPRPVTRQRQRRALPEPFVQLSLFDSLPD